MRAEISIPRGVRRLAAAALACATLAVPTGATAAADVPPQVIKSPHYGDTLFQFYQAHYFTAVTALMVSQHFERLPYHADEAEVLRGGLMLSYGLHREAGEIFAKLIERGAAPAVRDRAWFFLAKIRYQRGFLPEAEDAIARIGRNLPPDLEEERALLHANVLLARGDYLAASDLLKALSASTGAGLYARFNLGVAMVKSGDFEGGISWLDEVGRAPGPNEEVRNLRDKANVALGFAALQDNRPETARSALERVRLSGMLSNKALLGFGWASAALKQPREALVPWTELAARDVSDAAVLEARIAVPYALAELGAYGQSLNGYNDAIASFEREHQGLNESIAAIRQGKLVDSLLERNPGEEMGWFWTLGELPELPQSGHLAQVLAQHEFQEAFKNLRDLRFLGRNLQDWQDNLGVFGDMLAARRQAYAERLPQVLWKARDIHLSALQQRRNDLAKELERAEKDSDGSAFANPKERGLMTLLDDARENLKQLSAEPQAATAQDRLRLAAGALTWQLAQAYPARAWEANKALKVTDTQLGEASRREAALAQAQRDEPVRFERFAARIAELDARLRALTPRVAALSHEQQLAVQGLAVAELERQQERLASYTTQARFALAQIYDRANFAKGGGDAAKP
jgi:hypothetical protein